MCKLEVASFAADLRTEKNACAVFVCKPSVATPKPAMCGHLKTGHMNDVADKGFYSTSLH